MLSQIIEEKLRHNRKMGKVDEQANYHRRNPDVSPPPKEDSEKKPDFTIKERNAN